MQIFKMEFIPYCLREFGFWFKIKQSYQKIYKCIINNDQELDIYNHIFHTKYS